MVFRQSEANGAHLLRTNFPALYLENQTTK